MEAFQVIDETPPSSDHFEAEVGFRFRNQTRSGFGKAGCAAASQGLRWSSSCREGGDLMVGGVRLARDSVGRRRAGEEASLLDAKVRRLAPRHPSPQNEKEKDRSQQQPTALLHPPN